MASVETIESPPENHSPIESADVFDGDNTVDVQDDIAPNLSDEEALAIADACHHIQERVWKSCDGCKMKQILPTFTQKDVVMMARLLIRLNELAASAQAHAPVTALCNQYQRTIQLLTNPESRLQAHCKQMLTWNAAFEPIGAAGVEEDVPYPHRA